MSEWRESEGDEWKGELPRADGPGFYDNMEAPKLLGMFILDENQSPILADSTLHWGRWMEDNLRNRHVGDDTIGNYRVSTVFLGLDHKFSDRGWPVLFETMVFRLDENGQRQLAADDSDDLDMMQERYTTWQLAEQGHARMCQVVRDAITPQEAR